MISIVSLPIMHHLLYQNASLLPPMHFRSCWALYLSPSISSSLHNLGHNLANPPKASTFVSNGVFLLGAIHGIMCAADSTTPETQVTTEAHMDSIASGMMSTVAADFKIKNIDASFDDPGGHAIATTVPEHHTQALHGSDAYVHPQATAGAHPTITHMVVKCNNQDLQVICGNPPISIRCAEGCNPSTVCPMIMDRPHVLCESECICIAGDKATIPTINEFAGLE